MSAESNTALIREFLDALSGRPKRADVVHRYVAEQDEPLRHHLLHYEAAFPRFELVARDLLALGTCVLVPLLMRGIHTGDLWCLPPTGMRFAPPVQPTHTGEFRGLPPTGRTVVLPMTALFRVSANRVVEHRLLYDATELLRQLGISRHPVVMGERLGRRIPLWSEIEAPKFD
jgi:predicted ester cyclase